MNVDKSTTKAPSGGPQYNWGDAVSIALLTMAAIVLRWPQMHESLWIDELHTAWAISGGLGELPSRCAIGNQSPVWFLLPWLSVKVLGMTEVAVRLPSLLAGVALIPSVYWLTRQLSSSRIGACAAAAIVVFDQSCLTFASEARPYVWVQLVGVLQVAAFWNCLRAARWKARIAFVGLNALLFYLHYTAILLFAGEFIFYLIAAMVWRGKFTYSIRQFALDALGVALLCMPALPHLLEIAGRRENWATFISSPSSWGELALFPLLAYLIAPLVLTYAWVVWQKFRGVERSIHAIADKLPPMLLVSCWLLIPPTIAWVFTHFDIAALWLTRYLIVCAVALPVLVGLLVNVPAIRRARCVIAVCALLSAFTFAGPPWWLWWQTGYWTSPRGEDWRAAVAHINDAEQTDPAPVLLRADLIEANALAESEDPLLREYCLLPIRSIYMLESTAAAIPLSSIAPGKISSADLEQLRDTRSVWIVTRGRKENAEATFRLVLRTLATNGMRARKKNTQAFGRVWVMRVEFANQP